MLKKISANNVFCVGIGGIGVSGLAELLHQQGITVSGSDVSNNRLTQRLKSLGVTVYDKHEAHNINGADLVVYTSAAKLDNPERQAATAANIPQMSRGQLLAEVMRSHCNIIVAGTHGKTTTSGLLSWVFEKAGEDPSFVVGGVMRDRVSPMRLGQSRYFIAESDESDASFLLLSPTVAVITNIDADHMETYDHDFDVLKNSFLKFVEPVPADGFVMACIDNPVVRELIPRMSCRVLTYGTDESADYQLVKYEQHGLQSELSVKMRDGTCKTFLLNMAGKHNALNALATLAVAREYGISDNAVNHALGSFPGMGRRFQPHGEITVAGGTALLFDDYGHHPVELDVTLQAAKSAFPDRRVVLVFQPHRYSRTRDLMQEFIDVLKTADQLVLTEIYAASEAKIEGIDGQALFEAVKAAGATHACFVPDFAELPNALHKILKPNDVVILQGAGNIVTMADVLVK